jgi:hypothetical protein
VHCQEKRIARANLKSRAVGAMLVSPALQRGESDPAMIEPESRRGGAFSSHTYSAPTQYRIKKHKPGTTPVNVKLRLSPRQSRGAVCNKKYPAVNRHSFSAKAQLPRYGGLSSALLFHVEQFRRLVWSLRG